MPLYHIDGEILQAGGELAASADCCCSESDHDCGDCCPDGTGPNEVHLTLSGAAIRANCPNGGCLDFNATWILLPSGDPNCICGTCCFSNGDQVDCTGDGGNDVATATTFRVHRISSTEWACSAQHGGDNSIWSEIVTAGCTGTIGGTLVLTFGTGTSGPCTFACSWSATFVI